MDSITITVFGLLAVAAISVAGAAINMRKRLDNAEEAKTRLKEGFETKLGEEKGKRRALEQELSKAQDAFKRLREELGRRANAELERQRVQEKQREHEKGEKEHHDRMERYLNRLATELNQSVGKLSQLQDEMKYVTRELREQERSQRLDTERQEREKAEKEFAGRFMARLEKLEKTLRAAKEEQAWLNEQVARSTRDEERVPQELANDGKYRNPEIKTRDKAYREFIEQLLDNHPQRKSQGG